MLTENQKLRHTLYPTVCPYCGGTYLLREEEDINVNKNEVLVLYLCHDCGKEWITKYEMICTGIIEIKEDYEELQNEIDEQYNEVWDDYNDDFWREQTDDWSRDYDEISSDCDTLWHDRWERDEFGDN